MRVLILFLLPLFSFAQSPKLASHLDMLKNAKVVGRSNCGMVNNLSFSNCLFKEKDTIRFCHDNDPPIHGNKEIMARIDSVVVDFFEFEMQRVAIHDESNPDIIIKYNYLDGISGTLARAHYPRCDSLPQHLEFDNYDLPCGPSTPDSIKKLYRDIDVVSITKHELGHIVGYQHSSKRDDLMFPIYKANTDWSTIERRGFKLLNNSFIKINRGDNYKITKNFRINEFFSKCKEVRSHKIHTSLILTVQIVRDFFGEPIYITSSHRSKNCNNFAGGVRNSQHLVNTALDFKFKNVSTHQLFVQDVLNKGYLYKMLRKHGVRGIGIYKTHIHIDYRKSKKMVIWDYRNAIIDHAYECID